ncbi:manganese-dependent inorganic pyrophosphatase [Verrucomicrobium sp. GAS474]|uniref:putative manganese-dependent inorganic diphosphatase n=1 Tax=Verrucomicrobium sp. GAS474 TaxID=1882831 RepID=UPI00087B1A94|nr:putative manganese-dependent inorganic diphosphatase [Verrucomicrobium sp. GAS474]SDT93731.1 manganese-dependent inorganic pyrophosphatase [Verrucomicrobium sp. GAS474]
MPTYVIGHLNPDTDAICSAIAYADFLRRTGRIADAEAARCGDIGERIAFVLKEAALPEPKLLADVRPTAGRIAHRNVKLPKTDDTFLAAFDLMRAADRRSLPVVDASGGLAGMVSLFKLGDLLLPPAAGERADEARRIETNLARIAHSLGLAEGKAVFLNEVRIDAEEKFHLSAAALTVDHFRERLKDYDIARLLVIAGDRPDIQKVAIDLGVRALVLTGGTRLSPELLAEAKRKEIAVLVGPDDTATTIIRVKCSKPVGKALEKETPSFPETTFVADLLKSVEGNAHDLFPVVDGAGKVVGFFAKDDLIDPPRERLVLVDHNEWSQTVRGAQEAAEIVEVIDHHRLGGGLATQNPIRFINEPVGSTCTLVARFFAEAGIEPTPGIALALAAGVISDTLFLTSPTTTDAERALLPKLEKIAGRSLKEFSDAFFATGSLLATLPAAKAIKADCKEFEEAGWRSGVAQIEEQSLDKFWERKAELQAALDDYRAAAKLDLTCVLVTDITKHDSVLLVSGVEAIVGAIGYAKLEENLYECPGVVSRKKQLLPELINVWRKARAGVK